MNSRYLDENKAYLDKRCEKQCKLERQKLQNFQDSLRIDLSTLVTVIILSMVTCGLALVVYLYMKFRDYCKKDEVRKACEENIKKYEEQREREYATILEQYTKGSEQRRQHYAASAQLQQIVDWLTSGYLRRIDAANRAPHIQTVTAVVSFHVMLDKIVVDPEPGKLAERDFSEFCFAFERIADLNNLWDCIGLGRALTDRLKIEIRRLRPVDHAGGTSQVRSKANDADIELCYLAANGRFKQAVVI